MDQNIESYRDLSEFLSKHITKPEEQCTHTRIPDKSLNIYAGSYHIPSKELPTFYTLYYPHVFTKKKPEYLTERQIENGPLLIDLDFHYSHKISTRQHTDENIQDLISIVYLEILKVFFLFQVGDSFNIHVMQKPNVNRLKDESMTKDGIHLNISLQMDHVMQQMVRERAMEKIPEIWDLPLINAWDKVLDEGISKGCTNWQLLGSRKPNNEAYEITESYKLTYCEDSEFTMEEITETISLSENFEMFSAQYQGHPKFEINPKIKDEYERRQNFKKQKKPTNGTRIISKKSANHDSDKTYLNDDYDEEIALEDIKNIEMLEKAVNQMLSKLLPCEHEIKSLYEYTQILPEKYYEPGSHEINRRVAFALKQTDERLFLSWIMLRSKADDFDYDTIPDLHFKWKKYFKIKPDGITKQSILFWAKTDAPEEFERIKMTNISHFVDETLLSPTDYDFAYVLFLMFKEKFVCSELGNGSSGALWYMYENHHWTKDLGQKLRQFISQQMYTLYSSKMQKQMDGMQEYEPSDERYMKMQKKGIQMSEVINRLKNTSYKNNIMREASVLFYNYNEDFTKKMDTNKHLMCFSNGVVDFKSGLFRDGMPEDCITKTTGIPYVDITKLTEEHQVILREINECFLQIFPVPELNNYVLEHLASTLIGENLNQTFNIYYGSGSNGKSVLTDLMSHALGEYKGTVPISMITEKRAGVGGLSPEVIALKGVRYAVLQEPTKGMKLNEGFMKELTGGDAVTARTLFRESETFVPQFDVAVCTNNLFEIGSNDDGTWRRIRVIKFLSKFLHEYEWNDQKFDDCKYKYPRDDGLKNKYPEWAPIFAGMLVQKAFETKGIVKDCDIVMEECNNYRRGQDHISGFINEKVEKCPGRILKKKELSDEFKNWFELQQGSNKNKPKGVELYEYMDKKFGKCRSDGWHNVGIVYPDVDEMQDMTNA